MNDLTLNRTTITTPITADYYLRRPSNQQSKLYLLLHGYSDRALTLWRKISPIIKETDGILAVNGLYPVIIPKDQSFSVRFAWYFYDTFKHEYFINQTTAAIYLKNLLISLELNQFPLTIIGHSQGGYLAPFAGVEIESTHKIIGINCQFKEGLLPHTMPFELIGVHGEEDTIVDCNFAKINHQKIIQRGNKGEFISLPKLGHHLDDGLINFLKEFLSNE